MTVLSGPANSDDPRASATHRAMQAVVIVLGVLIVLALIALVAGAVFKLGGHRAGVVNASAVAALPPGAKITAIQTNGNRLILGVHAGEGDEVEIVDTETGRLVARIKAPAPDVPK